jgi:hypothetical protein
VLEKTAENQETTDKGGENIDKKTALCALQPSKT